VQRNWYIYYGRFTSIRT